MIPFPPPAAGLCETMPINRGESGRSGVGRTPKDSPRMGMIVRRRQPLVAGSDDMRKVAAARK
jgi:hypothetical protein